MLLKFCTKCGWGKSLFCFAERKGFKQKGRRGECKECQSKYGKQNYQNNKERILEKNKNWRLKNKERISIRNKRFREENKEVIREEKKKDYQKNKEARKKTGRKWRQNNKEKTNLHERSRKINDPCYKLKCNLRTRLKVIIKKGTKVGSAVRDLGCSADYLRWWLEQNFHNHPTTGEIMTWENYGKNGWHIDHIIPLSMVNLQDEYWFKKVCHFTNLQPLWREENIAKGNKI